jgi:hypothetical protein
MTHAQYIMFSGDVCENLYAAFCAVKEEVIGLLNAVGSPDSKKDLAVDGVRADEAVFVLEKMNLGFVSEDGMAQFKKVLKKTENLGLEYLEKGNTPDHDKTLKALLDEAHEVLDWEYYQPITAIIKGKAVAVRKDKDVLEKRDLTADEDTYWLVGIKERTRRRTCNEIRELLELGEKDKLVMQYTLREKSTGKYTEWFVKGI